MKNTVTAARGWRALFEFFAIVAISIGMWVIQAFRILWLHYKYGRPFQHSTFTDQTALRLVGLELVLLIVVYAIGKIRGWSFSNFGLRVSWRLTGIGLLIFLLVNLPLIWFVRDLLGFTGHISWPWLLAVVIVNPFFEETIEVGYIVFALERYNLWLAIFVSAALRAAIHIYAGWTIVAYVFIAGIIYAAVYAKFRQLWPLLLLHCLADLLVLFPLLRS